MSPYHFPFIGRPFKGQWYYEWQIGPVVFMWQHDMTHKGQSRRGPRIGRLYIWRDTVWRQFLGW